MPNPALSKLVREKLKSMGIELSYPLRVLMELCHRNQGDQTGWEYIAENHSSILPELLDYVKEESYVVEYLAGALSHQFSDGMTSYFIPEWQKAWQMIIDHALHTLPSFLQGLSNSKQKNQFAEFVLSDQRIFDAIMQNEATMEASLPILGSYVYDSLKSGSLVPKLANNKHIKKMVVKHILQLMPGDDQDAIIKKSCVYTSDLNRYLRRSDDFYKLLERNNSLLSGDELIKRKDEIYTYLGRIVDDSSISVRHKIQACYDAINPKGTMGSVLFNAKRSEFLGLLFSSAQPRLSAGTLLNVMELIEKKLLPQIKNHADAVFLKTVLTLLISKPSISNNPESMERLQQLLTSVENVINNLKKLPSNQYAKKEKEKLQKTQSSLFVRTVDKGQSSKDTVKEVSPAHSDKQEKLQLHGYFVVPTKRKIVRVSDPSPLKLVNNNETSSSNCSYGKFGG